MNSRGACWTRFGLAWMGVLFFVTVTLAEDWPCWRGPNRDGISRETGLLREWPKNGPPVAWKSSKLGKSLNGMIVVGPSLYTIGTRGSAECVLCIHTASGKTLWIRPIGKEWNSAYYPMMRSTPTFHKNTLYVFSSIGNLVSMNAEDGRTLWVRNAVSTMGGKLPAGGYAESPYVDGKWVLVCPGGPNCSMIAMNRNSGKNVWVSKAGMEAGYSSIVKASFGREHQYVSFSGDGVYASKVRGGDVRWRYEKVANDSGTSVTNLLWFGQTILASSTEGTGCIWLQKEGNAYRTEEVWFNEDLSIPTGDMVKVNDYVFACTPEDGLVCFDYKTGKTQWKDRSLFPTAEEEKKSRKSRAKEAPAKSDGASLAGWIPYLAQDNPLNALVEETGVVPKKEAPAPEEKTDKDSDKASEKDTDKAEKAAKRAARRTEASKEKTTKTKSRKKSAKKAKPSKAPACMASMTYAEGLLYVYTSSGALALVEANKDEFKLRGLIRISKRKGLRPTPVIANGHLYIREGETIYCFDIRQSTAEESAPKEKGKTPENEKSLPGMPKQENRERTAPTRA